MDTQTETVTGARIMHCLNAAISGGGVAEIVRTFQVRNLEDVAMALDEACDEARENIGGYGNVGCGTTWVEVVFNGDDPEDEDTVGQRIDNCESKYVRGLPPANLRTLRRFVHDQQRKTVWDGNNHVGCSTYYSEELLRD